MFTLPNLPFAKDSLQPFISAETLDFHHGKHHAAYVNKLNELMQDLPQFAEYSLVELLQNIDYLPPDRKQAVFNNAGQHFNHSLYWESLGIGTAPSEAISLAIVRDFGSMENFQNELANAAISQFGSGWAWVSVNQDGKLQISKSSNADSPITQKMTPILALDVWEHAYYIDYRNRRPEYVQSFMQIINWDSVTQKYLQAVGQ